MNLLGVVLAPRFVCSMSTIPGGQIQLQLLIGRSIELPGKLRQRSVRRRYPDYTVTQWSKLTMSPLE